MFLFILSPFQQQGDRQKIPVQNEQGPPEIPGCAASVTEHLHHMGNMFLPKPVADSFVPVMELDGKGEAE